MSMAAKMQLWGRIQIMLAKMVMTTYQNLDYFGFASETFNPSSQACLAGKTIFQKKCVFLQLVFVPLGDRPNGINGLNINY
ncbi:MAG: hypothetical protein MJZ67_01620 [Bacteroidales bacterium]|nr:hypothetical protein [Bacteroidales bacterium]